MPNISMEYYPKSNNITAWTVGWGLTRNDGDVSSVLNSVRINIYDMKDCNRYKSINADIQVCAGIRFFLKDS